MRRGSAGRAGAATPSRGPPRALAQLVLLHLAGRRLRQLAELDLARRLESRQRLAREGDQLLARERCTGAQGDEALRALAPFLIGNRDDRRLEHVGMAHERALDLDCRDVLAARDDDVLGAVA